MLSLICRRFFGKQFKDEAVIKAIEKNALVVQFINDVEPHIGLLAVKKMPASILFISQEQRTEEMMMHAVERSAYHVFPAIKQKFRSYQLMMTAVKQCGGLLAHIDKPYRTKEMMLEAVKNDGFAIRFIGTSERTTEMMREAVKSDQLAIQFINPGERTMEIISEAIKNDGYTIEFVDGHESKPLVSVKHNGQPITLVDYETLKNTHLPSSLLRSLHDDKSSSS